MSTPLRIIVTIIPAAALIYARRFLPLDIGALKIASVPAADVIAALLLILLIWFLIAPPICRFLQTLYFRLFTLRDIRKQIRRRQRSLLNWLLSRPAHWGITGTASEPQYANTCEGLLALRGAGFIDKMRESYRNAMQTLTEAVVPTGLASRTVNRPTVINTSMLLCLVAQEKKTPADVIDSFDFYDEMAANLWFLHTENGWGPLILRADKKEFRFVSTWWALRALFQYGYLEREEDGAAFRQFLNAIYEKNRGGTFGYTPSDAPRLTVTAMYLLLYYELPRAIRKEIAEDYDPVAAADFICQRFVTEKCQVEVECIDGTFAGGSYIAHTPWKHIASAYALQALSAARKNGDISRHDMDKGYRRTFEILTRDLRSPAANESCYIPADIEISRTGPYTFAAAHLILGLQALI